MRPLGIERGGEDAVEFEGGLRGEFAGLEDDGVAGGQGGEGIGRGDGERIVPGGDDADDTERLEGELAAFEAQGRIGVRDGLGAQDGPGVFGAEDGGVGGDHDVAEQRLLQGLAGFGGDHAGQRFPFLGEQLGGAAEDSRAADERRLRPPKLRLARAGNGVGNLRRGGDGEFAQRLAGSGVGGGKVFPGNGAADEMNTGFHVRQLYRRLDAVGRGGCRGFGDESSCFARDRK